MKILRNDNECIRFEKGDSWATCYYDVNAGRVHMITSDSIYLSRLTRKNVVALVQWLTDRHGDMVARKERRKKGITR